MPRGMPSRAALPYVVGTGNDQEATPMLTINTRKYTASHMHAPRGRGGWIFAPAGTENLGYSDQHVNVFDSTYTQAVAQLRNHVAVLRATGQPVAATWYVMP